MLEHGADEVARLWLLGKQESVGRDAVIKRKRAYGQRGSVDYHPPVGRQRLEHYVVRRLAAEIARDGAHQLQPRCRQMDGDTP